jgi:ectoine hydroxylase-related dioxygenase (phytanoyl-CoA dioxygenase family)
MSFQISQQERAAETISAEKLAAIVHAVRTIGYAVVEDIISQETCNLLADCILEDAQRVRGNGKQTRHEMLTGQGHLQLGLRRHAPFVKPDLVANPFVECVVAAVLGKGAWLGFYNGNVNCPGSGYQPLHFDRPYSWKTPEAAARDGQPWPPHTTTLSCSIALEDITTANGATEIYPGSHLEPDVANWTSGFRLEEYPELLARRAPARMEIPARSVCFRDPRMWHRGVPNPAEKTRPMIAVTYHAAACKHWRGIYVGDIEPAVRMELQRDPVLRIMDSGELGDGRLVFDADVRDVFEHAPSRHHVNRYVRFVDQPERVNHFVDAHVVGGARIIRGAEPAPDEA